MRSVLFVLPLLCAFALPAHALTMDFYTITGDTITTAESNAFQTAADAWESVLTNNVTVDVGIGFSNTLGSNVLGSTTPSLDYVNYLTFLTALTSNETTSINQTAVASLPATESSNILLTTAQTKALGLSNYSGSDGTIQFNSNFNFDNSRNSGGGIASNSYDLIGIAEHEIGHLLGFDSNLDIGYLNNNVAMRTALDMFRYSAPNTPSYALGASSYFSINRGVTNIAPFSTGVGDQASHWANGYEINGANALMDPEGSLGETINITSLDLKAMNAIGWNAIPSDEGATYISHGGTSVPEPMALAFMLPVLLAFVGMRRTYSFISQCNCA
jgi:hypothetical protein